MVADGLYIIVMAKPPILGLAKTRLAKDIGEEKALELYILMLDHTIDQVEKSKMSADIFWSEDGGESTSEYMYTGRIQKGEDLGARMKDAFSRIDRLGFDKKILIGADCPDLEVTHLEAAAAQLEKHDLVLGPSEDGGYYLIGMNGFCPELLENKTWSSPKVLDETLAHAKRLGKRVALLEMLNDVDDLADLKHSRLWQD